jgi:hypothetical protein
MSDIRTRLADALRQHSLTEPQRQYADFVADKLLSLPGIAIVDMLGPNQCGNCQHWSWEHKGPQHPCTLCDCEEHKPPDPDRTDKDMDEPY